MPNAAQQAIRAAAERVVELIAAWNRRRLPQTGGGFLAGIHKPMQSELTIKQLPVTASIPAGLNGRYLKMGANPANLDVAGRHWLLGDGMVHGFAIRGGAVRLVSQPLDSLAAGRGGARPFPCARPPSGSQQHCQHQRGRDRGPCLRAGGGGQLPRRTLRDIGRAAHNPFDGTLGGSFSGHPHRDPVTGDHHAVAYDGSIWDTVRYVVVSAAGTVVRDVPIAVQHGPCIHDCAITARFAIVLDLPVTFSMRAVLGGHLFPFRWNPSHQARLGLLPRDGGQADIIWCDLDPCFVFHVAMASMAEWSSTLLPTPRCSHRSRPAWMRWVASSAGRSILQRGASPAA